MNDHDADKQGSGKRTRRLSLSRETLRELGDGALARAAGGGYYEDATAYICVTISIAVSVLTSNMTPNCITHDCPPSDTCAASCGVNEATRCQIWSCGGS